MISFAHLKKLKKSLVLCVFHTISAGVRLLSFGQNAASAEGFFSCTPAVFSRVNAPRLTQPLSTICFLASEVKVRGRVRGGASVFFTFMNLMNTLLFKTYSAGASLKIETFHRITLGLQSMISSLSMWPNKTMTYSTQVNHLRAEKGQDSYFGKSKSELQYDLNPTDLTRLAL